MHSVLCVWNGFLFVTTLTVPALSFRLWILHLSVCTFWIKVSNKWFNVNVLTEEKFHVCQNPFTAWTINHPKNLFLQHWELEDFTSMNFWDVLRLKTSKFFCLYPFYFFLQERLHLKTAETPKRVASVGFVASFKKKSKKNLTWWSSII